MIGRIVGTVRPSRNGEKRSCYRERVRSTRRQYARTILVFSLLSIAAADAAAQMTAGVVVGASNQAAGASSLPSLGPGFGGTAFAIVADVDRPLRSHFALGVEASTAGAISGEQSQRTSTTTSAFTSHHRDYVFSGRLKLRLPVAGRVRAAADVGGGFAWRRTARDGTTSALLPPAARTPFSDTVSTIVLAYTLGVDVNVRLTDRIGAIAFGRRHRLRDADAATSVSRGVSSTIYRVGVGAQWRF